MATDLVGIDNENGYYPPAFMTSTLADEVNDAIERWNQEVSEGSDESPPHIQIRSVAYEYLQLLRRFRDAPSRTKEIEIAIECRESVLRKLDLPPPRKNGNFVELPSIAQVHDTENKCQVWIIEAPLPNKEEENTDLLTLSYANDQFNSKQFEARKESKQKKDRLYNKPLESVVTDYIFKHEERPRYVIVVAPKQLILIDRLKWPYKQILRFNLEEIFERQDALTLNVFACFISRKALVPNTGVSLAERLEEESQRHANAVTSSLKRTVRDAIEILGNEVLQVCKNKYPSGHAKQGKWIESKDLSQECLRFMYQLLFLFLVEANPKYDIIPLKDPAYNKGYSLESLRRLESIRLGTNEDKTGTFLWESLQILLRMMGRGVRRSEIPSQGKAFELPQMRVKLLDSKSTPILSNENVTLRNEAIQEIIRKLSLNQDKSGKGRISYVNLGIGQLGAVYETLIAFTGTVAKNDLLELVPFKNKKGAKVDIDEPEENDDEVETVNGYSANDKVDLLAPSYFVEKSRAIEFKPEQIVYEGTEPKVHKKGSFIYRLAGRDRQKSASYYTPEPLARVLVKHTLMERCKGLKADELLDLKILEPAMGSAAFLVETTNQLAEMYLDRKQEELKRQIPQNEYFYERQRVRSYIADRNCFGIDLNPIAIELGEVSLWLNGLHKSEISPWFGGQLITGNSLIGARQASYPISQLKARKRNNLWFNQKPEEIGWSKKRPKDHVWQFLLPDMDMAKFEKDKSIAGIAGEHQERIRVWKRSGVFTPYDEEEIEQLLRLSEEVDKLFEIVADQLSVARKESNEDIRVWPREKVSSSNRSDHSTKQKKLEQLTGSSSSSYSPPYERLKTVMDAWCALWLWPLDKSHLLPSRREFIHSVSAILLGNVAVDGSIEVPEVRYFPRHQARLIGQDGYKLPQRKTPRYTAQERNLIHETNIDILTELLEWIHVANEVSKREPFTHFELYFADIMREKGGFDLIVGNPPWISPSWNLKQELTNIDSQNNFISPGEEKQVTIKLSTEARAILVENFFRTKGTINFTGSKRVMPYSGNGKTNFYKCFIDISFRYCSPTGFIGLIHQDSHLGESKAGLFRSHWYSRIIKNFNFINLIKTKNFSEIGHAIFFSLNIYRGKPESVNFDHIMSLYLPSQIEESYSNSDSNFSFPYLRNEKGKWEIRGHRDRIIKISLDELKIFHAITEDATVPLAHTRIVKSYSSKNISILRKVSTIKTLKDQSERNSKEYASYWHLSGLWCETGDRKKGIIRRETKFTQEKNHVLQGPFIHTGNPLYKTPKRICVSKLDYTPLDLSNLPNKYLQRTNFYPAIDDDEYRSLLPDSIVKRGSKHTDHYRVALRRRLAENSERRLIGTLIPPDIAHVQTINSIAFNSEFNLLNFHSLICSLVMDYLLVIKNVSTVDQTDIEHFPWVQVCDTAIHRGLRLSCLTESYSALWNRHANHLVAYPWSSCDHRLMNEGDYFGPFSWDRAVGLRTEFSRRMALVEIDVLVAQAMGLSLEDLIEIYKTYFPVMRMYENATWYDSKGRIAWTVNSGLPGIGWRVDGKKTSRNIWEQKLAEMDKMKIEEQVLRCTVVDDTHPEGPQEIERVFFGPFTKCDRVKDYERAWKYFEEQKGFT